jgi:hypothetical protein
MRHHDDEIVSASEVGSFSPMIPQSERELDPVSALRHG